MTDRSQTLAPFTIFGPVDSEHKTSHTERPFVMSHMLAKTGASLKYNIPFTARAFHVIHLNLKHQKHCVDVKVETHYEITALSVRALYVSPSLTAIKGGG